jgi:putative aldouronate transport system permease protein
VKGRVGMSFRRTIRERAFDGVILTMLGVVMLVTLIPILYVTIMSFFNTNGVVPKNFSIDAYRYIFSTSTFISSIGISTFVTVVGTLFSMLVTVLMAYSLSCKQLRGRSYLLFFIVFTMMFNGGMIPTFLVVKQTGLYNSIWSLIIPSAVSAYNLILMKNYFQELPDDIKESARIDGCHELRIVFTVLCRRKVEHLHGCIALYQQEPALARTGAAAQYHLCIDGWNRRYQQRYVQAVFQQ